MNSIKPFKLNMVSNGKLNSILMVYYKDIDKIPIYSCNKPGCYKIVKVSDKNIIILGTDILTLLSEESIKALIWSLILKLDTGLNKVVRNEYTDNYLDHLLSSICGYSTVVNMLKQLLKTQNLSGNQLKLIKNRIGYIENMILNNVELKELDEDSILNRVNITRILEVT